MNSEEFNNGWISYYLGLDLKDNSHKWGSKESADWICGYLCAEDKEMGE